MAAFLFLRAKGSTGQNTQFTGKHLASITCVTPFQLGSYSMMRRRVSGSTPTCRNQSQSTNTCCSFVFSQTSVFFSSSPPRLPRSFVAVGNSWMNILVITPKERHRVSFCIHASKIEEYQLK